MTNFNERSTSLGFVSQGSDPRVIVGTMINKPLLPPLQCVCPDHCLIASRAPLNCQLGGESRAAITMGGVCLCIHSRQGEVNMRALEAALNTRVLHVPSLAFPAHQCKFIFLRKYNEQKKVMPGLGKSTQLIGSFFSALKTLYLQINSVYYSVFAAS